MNKAFRCGNCGTILVSALDRNGYTCYDCDKGVYLNIEVVAKEAGRNSALAENLNATNYYAAEVFKLKAQLADANDKIKKYDEGVGKLREHFKGDAFKLWDSDHIENKLDEIFPQSSGADTKQEIKK